jgi:hypothetical protein
MTTGSSGIASVRTPRSRRRDLGPADAGAIAGDRRSSAVQLRLSGGAVPSWCACSILRMWLFTRCAFSRDSSPFWLFYTHPRAQDSIEMRRRPGR